jgi:hypothetical protein
VALAFASWVLYRAKRAGQAAFPTSTAFERAGTFFCKSATQPHRYAPLVLLGLRTFGLLWHLVVLINAYASGVVHPDLTTPPSNLAKFTVWNYHLQVLFWLLALLASFRSVTCKPRVSARLQEPLATSDPEVVAVRLPDALLGKAVQALLSVCVPTSVLVSLVFWGILVPGAAVSGVKMSEVLHFTSYNMHAVNTLVLLAEFYVDRMEIPPQQLLLYLSWGLAYTVFQWAIYPKYHEWAYPFLRLTDVAPAWYGGVLVVFLLLYWAAVRLSALKRHMIASRVELEDTRSEVRSLRDQVSRLTAESVF